MSPRLSRALFAVLSLAVLVLAFVLGFNPRRAADFHIYLTAAHRFLHAEPLYRVADGFLPFKYLPASAALFVPFLAVPERVAAVVWNVGSGALLVYVTSRVCRGAFLAGAFALVACAQSIQLELFYGQVDAVCLALLFFSAAGSRVPLRGLALAVAILLKPTCIVFALWQVKHRGRRVLGFTALFGALALLGVAARYGFRPSLQLLEDWLALTARTTRPWLDGYNAQGIPSMVAGLVHDPARLLFPLQLGAMLLAGLALWRSRGDPLSDTALMLLAVVLSSPLAWRANFVLALPALVLVASVHERVRLLLSLALLLVGLLVSGPVLGPDHLREVLLWRPFGIVYLGLAGWLVLNARDPTSRTVPSTSASPGPRPSSRRPRASWRRPGRLSSDRSARP